VLRAGKFSFGLDFVSKPQLSQLFGSLTQRLLCRMIFCGRFWRVGLLPLAYLEKPLCAGTVYVFMVWHEGLTRRGIQSSRMQTAIAPATYERSERLAAFLAE
jgi:hypothetical protein